MSTQNQRGLVPLVDGQQSYALVFDPAFASVPSFVDAVVQMPNSSGEVLEAVVDRSTLTSSGCTVWLSGVPSAASVGGYINWYALGPYAPPVSSGGTGIGVVQLFHRMGRRARGGDFTKLSMSEQTDLAEAANAALQRLYDALPTYFREKTEGFVLPAPLAIANVGVTQFGRFITGYAFTSAQFGQTVVLEGDPGWNQIIGTDELLNPYMGATGTAGGTVYGNAFHSDTYPMFRVIGNPQYANQQQSILYQNLIVGSGGFGPSWLFNQSVGFPQLCWTQTFGNSQGKAPYWALIFAPAPNQAYAINVRFGFWPKRLTLADYDADTQLVVPDQFIEPALIPMAVQELKSTPIWNFRSDRDDTNVDVRGDKGEKFAKMQPGVLGSPSNRVFTPLGW